MRKIILSLVAMMFFVAGSLLLVENIYAANGNATEDGGVTGSYVKCSVKNNIYTPKQGINSCFGGAWVEYKVTDIQNGKIADMKYEGKDGGTITVDGRGTIQGGTIKGCGETKRVYRLAPFYYEKGSQVVQQAGLYQTTIFRNNGGWYNYDPHNFTGAISWTDAKRNFNKAKKDKSWDGHNTTWDKVSMFCYDPTKGDVEKLKTREITVTGNTTIRVSDNGYIFNEASADNGQIGLKYSTDPNTTSVTVEFSHSMKMWASKNSFTDEEVLATGDGSIQVGYAHYIDENLVSPKAGDFPADGFEDSPANRKTLVSNGTINEVVVDSYRITINLEPGDSKRVCSTLTGYNAGIDFVQENAESKSYEPDFLGVGKTIGCIEITRPKEPSPPGGGNTPTAYVSGMSNTGVLFAGESSTIGWNASATGVPTHRLASYQAVSYLVDANIINTQDYVSGSSHTDSSPCYLVASSISGGRWCATVRSNDPNIAYSKEWDTSTTPNSSHDGTGSQSIVVPETIGAKYCTTLGYKFENWFGLNYQNPLEDNLYEWHNGSERGLSPYWYIFNSACSVIAKRPQVAVWNGSVYSASKIKTALSNRYNDTSMGTIVSDDNKTTAFGSWSEYLAIASSGPITGFGSGSVLAKGSGINRIAKDSGSKLTIANNTDTLGNAKITPNKSYVARMRGHLLTNIDIEKGTTTLNGYVFGGDNRADQLVVKYYENLKITGNITNAKMSGMPLVNRSLDGRNMPQMIIFVDGNVDIGKDVTQIDAWLIVSGRINTCAEFNKLGAGTTSASGDCNKRLQFNGPVSAGAISLNRTYGAESGTTRSEPAEVFNLDPYAYIWAYKYSVTPQNNEGAYNFLPVYSRELAPRY